jgi:predicted transcriptional regulator
MAATTTIRLPPKLRARIHALAKQSGRSAHSVILEAVERHADYEEQLRSLVKDAIAADDEIERTGEVYRAADVHEWMDRLARGNNAAARPKPWRR